MVLSEVKALADMGFSAEQIIALSSAGFTSVAPSLAEPKQEPIQEAPKAEPVQEEPKAEPVQEQKGVSMSEEQFTALMQKMNVSGAGIDVPPTYDLKKVLADHYTEVMVGE